jgi:hypothetical protein
VYTSSTWPLEVALHEQPRQQLLSLRFSLVPFAGFDVRIGDGQVFLYDQTASAWS